MKLIVAIIRPENPNQFKRSPSRDVFLMTVSDVQWLRTPAASPEVYRGTEFLVICCRSSS